MSITKEDIKYLQMTLGLAAKAQGFTNPNPVVGAVIVKNGLIIGQGYHKKYRGPHAEVEAFKNAKEDTQGATLYVSLEPCSHLWKNTPPCVGAVIAAGVKRVVCCTIDPNKKVSGQGIKQLRAAGIKVEVGALEKEAEALNEAFFCFHQKNRPFIVVKYACSLDGRTATYTGNSKWITNEAARAYSRDLRGQYQVIIVGTNTVLQDNPHLGVRSKKFKDPLRVILDANLKIKLTARVYRDNNVLVLASTSHNRQKLKQLTKKGIEVVITKAKQPSVKTILQELTKRKIVSLFVEGGAELQGSFLDAKMADKFYIFYAPIIIGGKNSLKAIGGQGVKNVNDAVRLKNISIKNFGNNFLITGYRK
ncbi:MAG: bifunctional diaminohydroxyphosphoribosylaminopyrimidine deaminase/5-amino-6-(5-phosphoribosylamino)uracil reductase RibD [Candidatus Magasanikbacteria bacterium]|nr:bifunctional diaminohydroxyphosphoribosylaminopyrimidine deaminase/5-amino-6-(5-phosphoribosylamino)uracil reductase RibD [Candidatus Magasanikbacteria bacterium]